MQKERQKISLDRLNLNEGQLDWLPRNPRQWTREDIDKTRASIVEDPDFLEDRPLLAVPFGKEFIVFAGNLRHEGCVAAKMKTVPVIVYTPESEEDYLTIKRRAMKDNGSFGSWDFDELANSWDDLPLEDYGIPKWEEKADPAVEENTTTEDHFDEDAEEIHVICKRGDIWQLGEHRLMCGDSISLEEVEKLCGGGVE